VTAVVCVVERRWKMVDVRKDQMVRGLMQNQDDPGLA